MIHYKFKFGFLISLSLLVLSCGGSGRDPVTPEVKAPEVVN